MTAFQQAMDIKWAASKITIVLQCNFHSRRSTLAMSTFLEQYRTEYPIRAWFLKTQRVGVPETDLNGQVAPELLEAAEPKRPPVRAAAS